jgi:DNA-binding transcriptional MocR family regulator
LHRKVTTAHPGQILLAQGTSQALELIIHYLLKPGDTALVDDPGYYNMFGNLRLQGVAMLAVPRNPGGRGVRSPDRNGLSAIAPGLRLLRYGAR